MEFIVNSKQVERYYEQYSHVDIEFNQRIYDSLKLVRKQIALKYGGGQRPCILSSSSLVGARVIVAMSDKLLIPLRRNNTVSLRYSFYKKDSKGDFFSFFVNSRITEIVQCDEKKQLHFVQLAFTQRPSDDLIQILGNLLDARKNAAMRKEERIVATPEALRYLEIASNNTTVSLEGVPRKGILRDLSFGGLKTIILGNPKFLLNKEAAIQLNLISGAPLMLTGKVIRYEPVVGRKDLVAIVTQFNEETLSVEYTMMINRYLTHFSKKP